MKFYNQTVFFAKGKGSMKKQLLFAITKMHYVIQYNIHAAEL